MPSTALKPKHPGGRPTAYRPEFGEMIIEAMATGLSAEAAAAKIGVSARSLFNWQKEHPEFLQSVQEGRHRALLWWETRALEMARGEPGNAQMVMLGLKNRSRAPSGWHHDSQRVEHSGDMTVEHRPAFDAATLSWDDRAELRRILLLTRGKGDEAALK